LGGPVVKNGAAGLPLCKAGVRTAGLPVVFHPKTRMRPQSSLARPANPAELTAAQIANAGRMAKRTVLRALANTPPAGGIIVQGNDAAVWTFDTLTAGIQSAITSQSAACGLTIADYLETFVRPWKPALPLAEIADACLDDARKLRAALLPSLQRMDATTLLPADRVRLGLEDYRRAFGHEISERHWQRLLTRTLRRDGGAEDWNRLEIYLPDRLKQKSAPAAVVLEALAADFAELEQFISACSNPHAPNKIECVGVWALALQKNAALVNAGTSEKTAAGRVRQFLISRATFLAASPHALRVAFDRKLARWKESGGDLKVLRDGRANNGDRVEIPSADIDRLRASSAFKNGGRIDSAWREEYPFLSKTTRARYPNRRNCPAKIHHLLNRKIVDALTLRHQGKRTLRRACGSVERDWTNIPSMHLWVVDDMTANLELAISNRDGSTSLITPQVIAVMDSASRKWVGWAISDDKAPTAELVCGAVLDAIRTHGVPKKLGIENGFVFGKSLNVNGKEDEQGRTIVAGLAQYGCAISHFDKMNPTSKAELEKSFDLIQRRMERHPGYTGRLQMVDAPEDFKLTQRLIRSGNIDAKQCRYTFEEGIKVISRLVHEYNSAPQDGHLNGLSPNEAFAVRTNQNDPPIEFTPELEWLLANERYRVTVETNGVRFSHYGRKIQVRGGRLAELLGRELWVLVDRRDDSLVTFMNLDYTNPFTMEVCQKASPDESRLAPGSGVLASERAKIREHERAQNLEYNRLLNQFGNPRQELLRAIRNESQEAGPKNVRRHTIIHPRMAAAAAQMNQQRGEICEAKNQKARRTTANKNKARRLDIPTVLIDDDEQTSRALELLGAAPGRPENEISITEGSEP